MSTVAFALSMLMPTQGSVEVAADDCGAQSGYMVMVALGRDPGPFPEFKAAIGKAETPFGVSMRQIASVLEAQGLHTLGCKIDLPTLERIQQTAPAKVFPIAHYALTHYVVIHEVTGEQVVYCEPPDMVEMPRQAFDGHWDGDTLLVSEEPITLPPAPTNWWWRAASAALAVLAVAAVGWLAWRRRRD